MPDLECEECGEEFDSRSVLEKHRRVEHSIEERTSEGSGLSRLIPSGVLDRFF